MNELELKSTVRQVLLDRGLSEEQVEIIGGQLLWRIGRESDESPVTVRMGLASSAPLFSELPRLRNASEAEILEAVQSNSLRVEWVGHSPG